MKHFNEGVIYAMGPEVEYTPAFSLRTLYVHSVRAVSQILEQAEKYKCKHIKLGAFGTYQNNKLWNKLIPELISAGYQVTLEYPASSHEFLLEVLDKSIWASSSFIPVATCELKQADSIKNLVIKVHGEVGTESYAKSAKEVLDSNRATHYSDYDDIIDVLSESDVKKQVPKAKTVVKDEPVVTADLKKTPKEETVEETVEVTTTKARKPRKTRKQPTKTTQANDIK